ncbi:NAD-dependent histone deacetylase sir2 [Mortierella sp. AD031]|nr:NAD-dependent histone deacetylase sir2 [Mortierella sp. AD031]KAG0219145.1 NAD-dependent histone deacetylase sir2 [Mortierella sp. NVP41]
MSTMASEAAIGNLTLGATPVRTYVAERAMGVITSQPNSRQGSPAVMMKSRESTPMSAEDELRDFSQHSLATEFPQRYPHHPLDQSPTPSDSTSSSEEGRHLAELLEETIATYDSDQDENYTPEADTTVDEIGNPLGSSDDEDEGEGEGDDSYSEIDPSNINIPDGPFFPHAGHTVSYYDSFDEIDPSISNAQGEPFITLSGRLASPYDFEADALTEEQASSFVEEARAYGIAYVFEKYILGKIYSLKQLFTTFDPEFDPNSDEWTGVDLMDMFSMVMMDKFRTVMIQKALPRQRLTDIHTLEQVVSLLRTSNRIMVLTGAGVSVSCGIPDFRSPDGIYSRLSEFRLREPQQMFDLSFFKRRPEIFYSFAREIFPSNFTPSPSHNFIKLLEDKGKLLRNYTQNIDTLEQKAGIQSVLQCHGSFATASCLRCRLQVPGDAIKDSIFKQEVVYCPKCGPPTPRQIAPKFREEYYSSDEESDSDSDDYDDTPPPPLMKPDIVFFREQLDSTFDDCLHADRREVDLLIVIGSSLKVAPVSSIIDALPSHVPQILINRTPLTHMNFDVQLLGNSDTIVAELCRMAGWELKHENLPGGTSDVSDMDTNTNANGKGRGGRAAWKIVEPNTYLFEGALLGEIEYETRVTKRKMSSRQGDLDMRSGSDGSDADDEGGSRSTHVRRARYGSAEVIEIDSDSDSNESKDAVRASKEAARTTGGHAGVAAGTTEPRTGDLAELHYAQSEEVYASHDHSQRILSDDEVEIIEKYTEKMPHDLGESEPMPLTNALHDGTETRAGAGAVEDEFETSFLLEQPSNSELRAIAEDPYLEEDSGNESFHTPNGSFQAPVNFGPLSVPEDDLDDLRGLSQQSLNPADLFSQSPPK